MMAMVAPRKKITIRKPGTGPSVYYFTADTQLAIIEYKLAATQAIKADLYLKRIYPAFKALVDNLINVYGFQVRFESKEDLRNECLEFLYGVITKFDPEKGSKAFAYFNVVAKHWLTIKAKQNSKNVQTFSSMDDRDSFSRHDLDMIENYKILPAPDEYISQEEQIATLQALLKEVKARTKTANETLCMEAIEEIFEKMDVLDFDNKRAVMVYIRNLTHLSPKQLSIVLSTLKKHYKTIKNEQTQ